MDNQNSNTGNSVIPAETSAPNQIESSALTLDQRVTKIQFHLQNMANSAIIIGQELTECKKEVGHGNWANWLKDNFNLSQESARACWQSLNLNHYGSENNEIQKII